jgi:hypothetical protein
MRGLAWGLLGVVLGAGLVCAEEITLATYYPSPRGVYRELRVTNNAYLAQQGGALLVGTKAELTSTPAPRLIVAGEGQNPGPVGDCASAYPGTSHYNEDAAGLSPDALECKPTALAAFDDGRVAAGRRAGPRAYRLSVVGWPLPDAVLPSVDLGLVLEPTGPTSSIELSFLRPTDGVPLAQLALANQPGRYTQGSQPGDLILRVSDGHDLRLVINPNANLPMIASTPVILRNAGHMGIGTTSPTARLDVRGLVRVGGFEDDGKADAAAPGGTPADGSLYYNTISHRFLGFQNGRWQPIAGGQLYTEAERVALFANRRTVQQTRTYGGGNPPDRYTSWFGYYPGYDPFNPYTGCPAVPRCEYFQVTADATAVERRDCSGAVLETGRLCVGCGIKTSECTSSPGLPSGPSAKFCVDWYGAAPYVHFGELLEDWNSTFPEAIGYFHEQSPWE